MCTDQTITQTTSDSAALWTPSEADELNLALIAANDACAEAPFGKLGLVTRPADQGGGYIGGYSKDGELLAGFAEVDPNGAIWTPAEANEIALALIACWNACADVGLTVEQLEAGVVDQAMDENAAMRDCLKNIALATGRSKTDGEEDCDWAFLDEDVSALKAALDAAERTIATTMAVVELNLGIDPDINR